jgi:hypothetical protein
VAGRVAMGGGWLSGFRREWIDRGGGCLFAAALRHAGATRSEQHYSSGLTPSSQLSVVYCSKSIFHLPCANL